MTANTLNDLRQAIGQLDQELLKIFAQRRALSREVASYKFEQNLTIRDQQQEKHLLTHLTNQGLELGIDPSTTLSLFHNIIEDSIRSQYDHFMALSKERQQVQVSVALLGEYGSYSHIAAQNHFSTKQQTLQSVFCDSFIAIFEKVANQEVELGLVPLENTTTGNISEVYDLLDTYHLQIVGEEKLKVKHCLVGTQQATIDGLTDVYSHPQAIAQCNDFFKQHPRIRSHYRSSSSSALKLVAEYQNPSIGAITSEQAAEKSGLKILSYAINNYQENYTRFLLISSQSVQVPKAIPAKITLSLQTEQKPGALVDCLQVLKTHDINMSKLESRPIPTRPWQETFYLDFEGNLCDANVEKALLELQQVAGNVRVLGCYPKHDILATKLDSKALGTPLTGGAA